MIINYHGKSHIKLQLGDMTIALGPVSKSSKARQTKYGADIALIPIDLPDYNGVDNVTHGSKEPFVINGAGEYEHKGVFIKAFSTAAVIGGVEHQNTSYVFNFDNIRILYLGVMQHMLLPEHKEIIDNVDLIFAPVGGDSVTLNPYDAYKLCVGLDTKVIIPIDYKEDLLAILLKESNSNNVEIMEKITMKYKDIADKEAAVMRIEEM